MRGLRTLFAIVGSIGLLLLAGCSAKPADPTGQVPAAGGNGQAARSGAPQGAGQTGGRRFATISVQALDVKNGPLITDNVTTGTVVPVTQGQVAAQVSGIVSKVLHRAGDWVKEGATVVQLDDSVLKLAVKNAQSALDNARINLSTGQQTATGSNPRLVSQLDAAQTAMTAAQKNYESQKKLFDLGGISSSQLDTSQSQLQQAQANVQAAQLALDQNQQSGSQSLAQLQLAVDQAATQLEIARLNLRNAAISAPFAGQIAAVNVTPGSYVSLNTPVLLLVSAEKQISFTAPPSDAASFKPGDTVQFTYAGKSYPVKIVQAPSAPINGVVPMVASVPPSVGASYGTVGTVTYRLSLGTGPLLPIAALQTRADQNFVYTIVNGKAAEQPVIILAEGGSTALVSGVEAGMQVIISPPPGLLAGSAVQAIALPAPQERQRPQGQASPAGGRTGGQGQQAQGGRTGGQGQRTGGATSTQPGQGGNP
jgi:HlyD family secretion protein